MQMYPAQELERAMKGQGSDYTSDEWTDQLDTGGRDFGDVGPPAAAVAAAMGGTRL